MAKKKMLPPIHLACSDDMLRPAMQYIHIKDGIATATNAYMLAQINLHEHSLADEEVIDSLDGKLIHMNVWKQIMDADILQVDEERIIYRRGEVKAEFSIEQPDLKFPDYDAILKTVDDTPLRQIDLLGVNAKLLAISSKILQTSEIKMEMYGQNRNMIIYSSSFDKRFVLMMPIALDKSVEDFDYKKIQVVEEVAAA